MTNNKKTNIFNKNSETNSNCDVKYKKKIKNNKKVKKIILKNQLSDNILKASDKYKIELKKTKREDKKESIGSNTAKNGLNEQEFIKNLINTDEILRKNVYEKFKIDLKNAMVKTGTSKTDISCENINIQVKKTKKSQFGQIDRHWINDLIEHIPKLKEIDYILKNMCELPTIIINGKKMCDKNAHIKKINNNNYSDDEIYKLLENFENNKKEILKYAFFGTKVENIPDLYIVSVFSSKRENIIIWKTTDIIDEILKKPVNIRPSGTVIEIGNCFTFQRKGGDNGKECANQFQFKFIPTALNIENTLVYKL